MHDELIELETRGWEVLCTTAARAREFYDEHLADEVVMLLPGGMTLTDREQILDSMGGPPWKEFRIEEARVLSLGEDAGVVAYGVVARRGGAPAYSALISSAYTRTPGGWRLAFHQQTPR